MIGTGYIVISLLVSLYALRRYRVILWGKCDSQRSMEGKVVIVTGANSGLGKETALELARKDAHVIVACRRVQAAKETIEDIRRKTTDGQLVPMQLDLASLDSVRNFATEVLKQFPEIHVLVNNAGVFIPGGTCAKTIDGFELHFGVNHLGHFLLTNLLLDRMTASAPARIVVVSSSLQEKGKLDFDNLNGEVVCKSKHSSPYYNNSKLANAMFSSHLSKLLHGTGVNVYCVCPGLCYTNLMRHTTMKWFYYPILLPVAFYFMRSSKQGAQTTLHCTISEEVENESGKFYKNCAPLKSKLTFTDKEAKKLWELSSKMVSLQT